MQEHWLPEIRIRLTRQIWPWPRTAG